MNNDRVLALVLAALAVSACVDSSCREGTRKIGTVCVEVDAGNAEVETDAHADVDEEAEDVSNDGSRDVMLRDSGSRNAPASDGRDGRSMSAGSEPAPAVRDDASVGGDAAAQSQPAEERDAGTDATPMRDSDACPSGGCVEEDPCEADPCPNGGTCTHTREGRSCDYCSPNPCQNGGSCRNGEGRFNCDCAEPYSGERCDLEICGPVTVQSRADVDANRNCAEIRGDLTIMASFAELGPEDFPGLTKITGRLTATGGSLVKLELPALQVVEGNITILGSTTLEELRLPSLTTIGTVTSSAQTQLGQSSLKVIEAPALTSVHGELAIATAASLCSLNFRRVSQIDGAVQLFDLPNLPYSATSSIRGAARGAVTARNIGCCTFSDLFDCSTFTNRAACNASCE